MDITRQSAFPETKWTFVQRAASAQANGGGGQALEELCLTYWPAIYGYARRCGFSPSDAEDRTQGFLVKILAGESLTSVSESRNNFRAWLKTAIRNFIINEGEQACARKRRPKNGVLSLDFTIAESDLELTPADEKRTPDEEFDLMQSFS